MNPAFAAVAMGLALLAPPVAAASSGNPHHSAAATPHSSTGSHSSHGFRSAHGTHGGRSHSASGSHGKTPSWVHRDSHGKIARDPKQLSAFKKQHPCPSTGKTYGSCPGYVVDHVVPLKRGGADLPSNMQWQTKAAAKQKDAWE